MHSTNLLTYFTGRNWTPARCALSTQAWLLRMPNQRCQSTEENKCVVSESVQYYVVWCVCCDLCRDRWTAEQTCRCIRWLNTWTVSEWVSEWSVCLFIWAVRLYLSVVVWHHKNDDQHSWTIWPVCLCIYVQTVMRLLNIYNVEVKVWIFSNGSG